MTGTPGPDGEDDYERDDPEDEHGHEQPPFCRRNIIDLDTTDGSRVIIDHLFPAAGDTPRCPSCDGLCIAPGLVGLVLDDASGLFTAEEALLIANRLTRGANLVLEATEDATDLSREAAKLGLPTDGR